MRSPPGSGARQAVVDFNGRHVAAHHSVRRVVRRRVLPLVEVRRRVVRRLVVLGLRRLVVEVRRRLVVLLPVVLRLLDEDFRRRVEERGLSENRCHMVCIQLENFFWADHPMRIEEIHRIRLKRAQTNHETYKQLFDACCDRIRRRAHLPLAPYSMYYQVPPFVWGRPPYKHSHALRYVSEKLRRNGFRVSESTPGTLLVEWTRPSVAPAPSKPKSKPKPAKQPKPNPSSKKLSARLAALRKQLG